GGFPVASSTLEYRPFYIVYEGGRNGSSTRRSGYRGPGRIGCSWTSRGRTRREPRTCTATRSRPKSVRVQQRRRRHSQFRQGRQDRRLRDGIGQAEGSARQERKARAQSDGGRLEDLQSAGVG